MGRPTSYNEEMVGRAQEYLESCVDETIDVVSGQSEKFTTYKQKTIVKLPTVEGLAVFLGVSRDSIYEWAKVHAEFSDIINVLRAKQAERLINMGLSGDYNPVIAKVLLSKQGYSEKTEQDIKHSGGVTMIWQDAGEDSYKENEGLKSEQGGLPIEEIQGNS